MARENQKLRRKLFCGTASVSERRRGGASVSFKVGSREVYNYSTRIKLSGILPIDSAARSAANLVGQIPESQILVRLFYQIRTYFERN